MILTTRAPSVRFSDTEAFSFLLCECLPVGPPSVKQTDDEQPRTHSTVSHVAGLIVVVVVSVRHILQRTRPNGRAEASTEWRVGCK